MICPCWIISSVCASLRVLFFFTFPTHFFSSSEEESLATYKIDNPTFKGEKNSNFPPHLRVHAMPIWSNLIFASFSHSTLSTWWGRSSLCEIELRIRKTCILIELTLDGFFLSLFQLFFSFSFDSIVRWRIIWNSYTSRVCVLIRGKS